VVVVVVVVVSEPELEDDVEEDPSLGDAPEVVEVTTFLPEGAEPRWTTLEVPGISAATATPAAAVPIVAATTANIVVLRILLATSARLSLPARRRRVLASIPVPVL
jgi:hypothetical protein